jgi:carboxymethylenebutenolidase
MRRSQEGAITRLPSRRQVIASAMGGGFALAVQPVSMATITTPSDGLEATDVRIPSGGVEVPGYRAKPAKGKSLPVVLVVHEIFGVHEHIKDVCRRLAKRGYLAIAPDLFARLGDASRMTDVNELRSRIVSKASDAQVMSDLDATVAFVKRDAAADISKLAITGFCWGGRIVWLYAAHGSAARAGVAWYGRLDGDRDPLHPKHPVDVAASLTFPVLGLYGGQDQGIPAASVDQMRKALTASGKGEGSGSRPARASDIKVYPEAGHAFFADYRPNYRREAAEDGWNRTLGWLKSHGVA